MGEGQDSLYKERASIYLRRIDTNPPQDTIATSVRDGMYTFSNVFFGTVEKPTQYKIWQPIDNQLLEVLGMQAVSLKWSSEAAALTIVAKDDNGNKSIQVYDADRLISEFTSGMATINFR